MESLSKYLKERGIKKRKRREILKTLPKVWRGRTKREKRDFAIEMTSMAKKRLGERAQSLETEINKRIRAAKNEKCNA